MAEYISFQPSDFFSTKLWTGTGAENAITGVGFQPDFTWIKNRDATEHNNLYDAVRGANKVIYSNLTNAEATETQRVKSFDSDGFTLGTEDAVNASGQDIVGWNWKANGAGSSNTDGSITSTVSANTTSGFSIVKWVGTGSNATIGHGLGAVPKMIIVKNLSSSLNWYVYTEMTGNTHSMILDTTAAKVGAYSDNWNNTTPTSSWFSVGTSTSTGGASGDDVIAYCFAEVAGFSKFSSYTGNGSGDGTFVYTGFKPAFTLMKRTNSAGEGWFIFDSARGIRNVNKWELRADTTTAEIDNSHQLDFLSNGVKIRTSGAGLNGSGDTYIYMAFAEFPIVSSNDIPCTAR